MADKVTEKALEKEIKQVEAKAEKKLIETEKKVVAAEKKEELKLEKKVQVAEKKEEAKLEKKIELAEKKLDKTEKKDETKLEKKFEEIKNKPMHFGLKNIVNAVREQDKAKLLQMSKVSLWLENYDDLFSDFDPRPYGVRALSDDFLREANKVSKGIGYEGVELTFLVPVEKRSSSDEVIIKKRLRDHFKKHFVEMKKEKQGILNLGLGFVFFGVIVMTIAAYVLFTFQEASFFMSFLVIMLEPAGWFLFWEGLDQIVFESKKKKPDVDFYHKMSKAEITFFSY